MAKLMLVNGYCSSSLVTDASIIFTIENSQDLDDLGVTSFGKLPLEPAFGDHVVWKGMFLYKFLNCKLGTEARVWRWVGAPNLQGTGGCYEQAQKMNRC